jgi:hypothetical protein
MKRKLLLCLTFVFFVMAVYKGWNDQYNRVENANIESDKCLALVHEDRRTIDALITMALAKTNELDFKKVIWFLPEIDNNYPYVVFVGGRFSKRGEFGPSIYGGARMTVDSSEMERKQGVVVTIKGGQNEAWPALVVRSIRNRACIDVHVSGPKVPIDIESGESTPLPKGWDWNADMMAMEIVDDQRRVIFQEEFIPTNQVIMRGNIEYENTMIEAGLSGWPSPRPHAFLGNADLLRIFLYPSDKYKGQRNPNYVQ